MVKNDYALLVHETLKSAYLKNEFINWAGVLNADSDVIIFGFHFLSLKCQGSTAVVLLVHLGVTTVSFALFYFLCSLNKALDVCWQYWLIFVEKSLDIIAEHLKFLSAIFVKTRMNNHSNLGGKKSSFLSISK